MPRHGGAAAERPCLHPALGMHEMALEVAARARVSFAAAAAEIERERAKGFGLLGVPGGR